MASSENDSHFFHLVIVLWILYATTTEVDMDEDVEPKIQTDAAGGDGSGGRTRIGSSPANPNGDDASHLSKRSTPATRKRRTYTDGSKRVQIIRQVTIRELSRMMDISIEELVRNMLILGVYSSLSRAVNVDTAKKIVLFMGYELI